MDPTLAATRRRSDAAPAVPPQRPLTRSASSSSFSGAQQHSASNSRILADRTNEASHTGAVSQKSSAKPPRPASAHTTSASVKKPSAASLKKAAAIRARRQQMEAEKRQVEAALASAAEVERAAALRRSRSEASAKALAIPADARPPFRPTSPSSSGPSAPGMKQFQPVDAFPLYASAALDHEANAAMVSPPAPLPWRKPRSRSTSASPTRLPAQQVQPYELPASNAQVHPAAATAPRPYVSSTFARRGTRMPLYPNAAHSFRGEIQRSRVDSPLRESVQSEEKQQPPAGATSLSASARSASAAAGVSVRVPTSSTTTAVSPSSSSTPRSSSSSRGSRSTHTSSRSDRTSTEERARRTLVKQLRALRTQREEAEALCAQEESHMTAVSTAWLSARESLHDLSLRSAALEAESLAAQDRQRAEVSVYQQRVLAIIEKNKREQSQLEDSHTQQRAQWKVDGAAELRAELQELASLEDELKARRAQQSAVRAELESSRAGRLAAMAEQVSCESTLRIHALDRSYAAKEKELLTQQKRSVASIGRQQQRLEATLIDQHARAMAEGKAHAAHCFGTSAESTKFLRRRVEEMRVSLAQREALAAERKEELQSRSDRLEMALAGERRLNFELDDAVQTRAELDHTNASILLLHDRCGAWHLSIEQLSALHAHATSESQRLYAAFHALLQSLAEKNDALKEKLEREALEHHARLKEGEARRKSMEEEARRNQPQQHEATAAAASLSEFPQHHSAHARADDGSSSSHSGSRNNSRSVTPRSAPRSHRSSDSGSYFRSRSHTPRSHSSYDRSHSDVGNSPRNEVHSSGGSMGSRMPRDELPRSGQDRSRSRSRSHSSLRSPAHSVGSYSRSASHSRSRSASPGGRASVPCCSCTPSSADSRSEQRPPRQHVHHAHAYRQLQHEAGDQQLSSPVHSDAGSRSPHAQVSYDDSFERLDAEAQQSDGGANEQLQA